MNAKSVYTKGLPHCEAECSKDNLSALGFAALKTLLLRVWFYGKQTCRGAEYLFT